jgi:1,4-dihydroxy-2-naphthoyl-CoA synthase
MTDPRQFTDVIYEVRDRAAWIIINRPKLYNAFRAQTLEELIRAFHLAANDRTVASIVLTGAGDKAFCTGGDQSAHEGQYDGRGVVGLPIDELQGLIRDVPKPVIARVNGFAIGGGNVLATLCDLTIAADTAQFGQVGPKVGSLYRRAGARDGVGQQGRPRGAARCRREGMDRQARATIADCHRARQAVFQRRFGQYSRRQQLCASCFEVVLRYSRVERRRRRFQ